MQEHLLRYDTRKLLVFIDLETFNLCLNMVHNLPWQAAMLKVVGNNIIDECDMYLKWETKLKISKEAAEITKFNQKTFDKSCIPAKQAFDKIYDWLSQADYIIGHNVLGFDIYLIYDMYRFFGKNPNGLVSKFIDTNALSKGYKLGVPYNSKENFITYQYRMMDTRAKGVKTNLTAMGREFTIDHDYDNLHNALVDLHLNKKVWDKLKHIIEI